MTKMSCSKPCTPAGKGNGQCIAECLHREGRRERKEDGGKGGEGTLREGETGGREGGMGR